MTGTGSGDAAPELLALDEVGDAAPPDTRNSDDLLCGLTRNGCYDGDRERDRTTDGVGVVSLPESLDMLDATAKSLKEHAGKTTGAGVWSLPDAAGPLASFLTKADQRVSSRESFP